MQLGCDKSFSGFLTTLSFLARLPGSIRRLFNYKQTYENGKIDVNIRVDESWTIVTIDDKVPVEIGRDASKGYL